eukprot:gene11074-7879_t
MLSRSKKENHPASEAGKVTLIDQQVIQQDWNDREFIETIDLKILKTVAFLNEFDAIVRNKIADLGEKLSRLERNVEFCEAAIKSTQDRLKREGKVG